MSDTIIIEGREVTAANKEDLTLNSFMDDEINNLWEARETQSVASMLSLYTKEKRRSVYKHETELNKEEMDDLREFMSLRPLGNIELAEVADHEYILRLDIYNDWLKSRGKHDKSKANESNK